MRYLTRQETEEMLGFDEPALDLNPIGVEATINELINSDVSLEFGDDDHLDKLSLTYGERLVRTWVGRDPEYPEDGLIATGMFFLQCSPAEARTIQATLHPQSGLFYEPCEDFLGNNDDCLTPIRGFELFIIDAGMEAADPDEPNLFKGL
jgi:hypothetical protein